MKQFESFLLDTANQCLWRSSTQIPLAPKPWAILQYLVEHPGRLITHDELLDALWPNTFVQPQILRTYMLDLRKALGDDAANPRYIQTIPKRGYRFVAAVASVSPVADISSPLPPSPQPPAPLPSLLPVRGGSVFGRQKELAQIATIAHQTAQGQRQTVFVTGEVGIGKTTLVEAFRHSLTDPQLPQPIVIGGQCVAGISGHEEYYPIVEALRQLCASSHGEFACQTLARLAPSWRINSSSSPATAEPLPGELCAALEEIASAHPLVLILEDLHWADSSTLHFLSALVRRRGHARLMLIATFRPQDIGAKSTDNPLKALRHDLLLHRLAAEIVLRPLHRSAMAELLQRELHQAEPPAGLVNFIHRRSEGNPLFAIAILEHLISQAFLMQTPGASTIHWTQTAPLAEMESEIPAGLVEMIEMELEHLSSDEQALLEAGSLAPIAFPAWSVAAALAMDADAAEAACNTLARRLYFLERAGQDELPDGTCSAFYVFSHGLFREVLYQRQLPAHRAQRHIRIAEKLAALFAGREHCVASDIAVHLQAAGTYARSAATLSAPVATAKTTIKTSRKTSTKA